jgi:hypothetical protein
MRPIAVSSISLSALRLRRACSARKARPRALCDSAAQSVRNSSSLVASGGLIASANGSFAMGNP